MSQCHVAGHCSSLPLPSITKECPCLLHSYYYETKHQRKSTFEEERFIWVYGFGGSACGLGATRQLSMMQTHDEQRISYQQHKTEGKELGPQTLSTHTPDFKPSHLSLPPNGPSTSSSSDDSHIFNAWVFESH